MLLAKRIVGGLLLIVWLAASALGQDDEDKPAKPATKKKPAAGSKSKTATGSKTTKPKAAREIKPRKNHPEPTDQQPENLLDVHEDPVLEDLGNQLDELNENVVKALVELTEKKASKKPGKEMLEVGGIHADILRMERLASRLGNAGEPLGWDMAFRKGVLLARFQKYFAAYRAQPAVSSQLGPLKTAMEKETRNKEKILPQVDKLCAADKWEEADDLLADNLRDLGQYGAYFDPQTHPYAKMSARMKEIDEKLHDRVVTAARDNAGKSLAEQWPKFSELLRQAQDAPAAIRAGGAAQVDGQALPGPEAIEKLGGQWLQAQRAAVRCQALTWALAATKTNNNSSQKLLDEQIAFDSGMRSAFVGIIAADAERATGSEAESLYAQYVLKLADLCALSTSHRTLLDPADAALTKLAARSERLAADAASYKLATGDLLRWRERTSQAYARKHKAAYPQIEEVIWTAAGTEGDKLGLTKRAKGEFKVGHSLAKASNVVLELAGPALLKQKVLAADLLGPRHESQHSLGSCQGLSFARLPALVDCSLAEKQLASDLLVSGTLPPLSLEAATALAASREGDFVSVGGEIQEIGVHAVVPRMSKLTESDWGLLRLAPLAPVQAQSAFEKQVYLRCDVRPVWVQQRYVFWEIPAGEQLSAAP